MFVTEDTFMSTIGQWATDVQREALALFRDGVHHASCVRIAISIVEGKDLKRAEALVSITRPAAIKLS